jgi:isopenicillin-N N-acyltransferase-like protein
VTVAPFPLIEIAGPPFARGESYGAQARKRILRSVTLYRGRLEKLGLTSDRIADLVRQTLPEMLRFGEYYVAEMEGIARGAGLALDDIVLVNARTEIVALAKRRETPVDGCTGVVVLPSHAAGGALIHAQNWDWLAACAETGVVLRIRRDDGPDILTFTEAGGLARSGLNAAGLAITANYLESDRDYRQAGVPLPLIRRRVLEQQHLALAIEAIAATPKACSNNMILSDAKGFAIDLECAPDEVFPLHAANGRIVHANHWQSAVALSKLKDTGLAAVPDSLYRDRRVTELLPDHPDTEDVKRALFDDFGAPYAVCRPPIDEGDGNLGATVAMIVMVPACGIMEICAMPAQSRSFERYSLE